MKFNPKNIPIPEAYIIGIILGVLLHVFFRIGSLLPAWVGHLVGWPLIILGAGFSTWAVIEAGEMDISSPENLVTSGPFAFSRNPMYVGWTLIYLGICFVLNSIWFLILFPLVAIYIHFVEIPNEERALDQKFGDRYREYREQVRRYL
jgi:protein-S-isoprenylcysteine O-methyltransferase Ste14